jgi:hypothetical protein
MSINIVKFAVAWHQSSPKNRAAVEKNWVVKSDGIEDFEAGSNE